MKNSKIDFFINYEKTACRFFFYFVRMFFGSYRWNRQNFRYGRTGQFLVEHTFPVCPSSFPGPLIVHGLPVSGLLFLHKRSTSYLPSFSLVALFRIWRALSSSILFKLSALFLKIYLCDSKAQNLLTCLCSSMSCLSSAQSNLKTSSTTGLFWYYILSAIFHKMPYFLQLFAQNLIKTLKHNSLHERLLGLAKSTSFDGFSLNAILFATFC